MNTLWNHDLTDIPKDGRWVLIIDEYGQPATAYWQVDRDGTVFGWTSDGGDRFEPVAWVPVTSKDGKPIFP